MTLTPAQAVAQVDSPRHDWDELTDQYKRHCQQMAAAAIAAFKVNEANVPLAPPEFMPPAATCSGLSPSCGTCAGCVDLAAPPEPPSFLPERDGTLGEVEPGDRVMWVGVWREVRAARKTTVGLPLIKFIDGRSAAGLGTYRIQKRATTTDGPPGHMMTAGGRVAYTTVRAGEVVPGMWVVRCGQWRQVVHVSPFGDWRVVFGLDNDMGHGCHPNDKVKVATTPEAQRLEAERQAQRAEAYDQACEART